MMTPPHPIFHYIQLEYGTISCGGILVTSRIQDTLYKHVTHNSVIKWMGYYSEPELDAQNDNLHWYSFEGARNEVSFGLRICVT